MRDAILRVASLPQSSPQSTRTAAVLQHALRENRALDVELMRDPEDGVTSSTPVKLEDVLLESKRDGSGAEQPQDISLRVSEPYRGGTSC